MINLVVTLLDLTKTDLSKINDGSITNLIIILLNLIKNDF